MRGLRQKFWQMVWLIRFQLLDRSRLSQVVLEKVMGHPLLVLPGVFHPRLFYTTEFLLTQVQEQESAGVTSWLDLGTGSGIGAIVAARFCERVVGVDLNPQAVRCARINVLLNEVEDRVRILEGDLFQPVKEELFEVVLFNPPYLPGPTADIADLAFRNEGVARRFAYGLSSHLQEEGRGWIVLSSKGLERGFLNELERQGLDVSLTAEKNLYSEVLKVYRLSQPR